MSFFDALTASWRVPCPHQPEPVPATLHDFRQISRMAGPQSPPAYTVRYRCPCGDLHQAILTGPALDLHPVLDPLPVYHDLLLGRPDWDPSTRASLWAQSIRRRRWPLQLHCRHRDVPVGGWPSLLRHLEPDDERRVRRMLVTFDCPACQRQEMTHLKASQLTLIPAQWS